MMGMAFRREDGVPVSSQMARLLRARGISYKYDAGGLFANFGNGYISVDCRHISGDRYEIVPKESNRRFRVSFTSLWSGADTIHSFDTFYEADFFREQVHGKMMVW